MKKILSLVTALALMMCVIAPLANAEAASSGENGVWIDFSTASDEELEEALNKIRAEQRSRIKTKIVFDSKELAVAKGRTVKLAAEITGVPEGLKAPKIIWESSDPKIAVCQQGTVRGVANGTAVIKASCALSDGTEIYNECPVTVFTSVTGISASHKKFDMSVGESVETRVTVQPADASNPVLDYTSSNESVATVDSRGIITCVGIGTATVTAAATDGSKKSVAFSVKGTKKDDRGKTKTDRAGNTVTLLGIKETKGSSYAKPDSGNIFVLIDLEIANKSSQDLSISSVMSFTAYCDGYTCDYSFSATLNTSRQMDGTISPGKKLKGQAAFEVPKNWKEIELHVKPDYWFGTDVEFMIYHQ